MKRTYGIGLAVILAFLLAASGWMLRQNKRMPASAVSETEMSREQETLNLYARSAVLMDADSGRILYAKNGETPMPMASTTKIMTLIVALEYAKEGETATASAYAAAQPKVHLGMRAGDTFRLEDLYYSLMLESHNDAAVCIAEHLGNRILGRPEEDQGKEASKEAVAAFIGRMNDKAKELGLNSTCFLTPNGLDAEKTGKDGEVRVHSTTAAELARMMRYCIQESPKKDAFLEITRTASYEFSDTAGKRHFSCINHNAFLQMMEGALSGKTGFTAKAGYCYVGALKQEERTFIVALLACGWPNNKTYKWVDTRKLMNYGLEHYAYQDVYQKELVFDPVWVRGGVAASGKRQDKAYTEIGLFVPEEEQHLPVLLKDGEEVEIIYEGKERLYAPVKAGDPVGAVRYLLNGQVLAEYPVLAKQSVGRLTFRWCLEKIISNYVPAL